MTEVVVLDTGVLGDLVRPTVRPEVAQWLMNLVQGGRVVCLPEIVDYELRRELILNGFKPSLDELDDLCRSLEYLKLDTETMRFAAWLWGQPA